jgi:hypothetical protein
MVREGTHAFDAWNKLNLVARVYQAVDREPEARGTGNGGFFAATPINDAVEILIRGARLGMWNLYPDSGYFMDAGSGDGRIVAALASLGYNTLGIEKDEQLYAKSQEILSLLGKRGGVNGNWRVVKGDFTQQETYERAGVRFEDIHNFFMGVNAQPLEKLVEMMQHRSPPHATLTTFEPAGSAHKNIPFRLMDRYGIGVIGEVKIYRVQ